MKLRVYAIALLALCAIPQFPKLSAQVSGGTISGTVFDLLGSVIPKARVEVQNRDTGIAREVIANDGGFFSAPNLVPGNYFVQASAPGFHTKGANLTVNVGDQLTLPFSLAVGDVQQTVEVMEAPPSIEFSSSALGATVEGGEIRDLPLNGRSWTDLATLQPGVVGISTQVAFDLGAGRGNRGFGAQISIAGGRPTQNNYRLDGISINDYANGGPGSVIGVNLGVDAIGEFSVLTSNYSAEYGKTSGGVVNAVTRTGSNRFHGSAYSFFRNSALDARNFFDVGPTPPFSRYQYGASAGGPIRKDHTFFFADFEAIRQSLGISTIVNTLSNSARASITNPAVLKYSGLFPIPNLNTNATGSVAQYSFVKQEEAVDTFFTSRIDHKLGAKDSMFGTYVIDSNPFTVGDAENLIVQSSKTRRQDLILEESHTFSSSFVNTARFGLNRQNVAINQGTVALNPLASDSSLGVLPGQNAPGVAVPGLTTIAGGLGSSPTYLFRFTTFQGYDDMFLTKGTHTIKVGAAFERMQNNELALSGPAGSFTFASIPAFMANTPRNFKAGIASTLTPRNLRQFLIGGYVQDDWHFKPNLTLNLGIRYEMSSVPTEVAGKLTTLRQISDAAPHLGDPYFANPTYKNFEPRVGFAYDPFKNHETSVRAGFGVYDVLPLLYQFELLSVLSAPYFENATTTDPGVVLGATPAYVAKALVASPATLSQAYIQPDPKRDYVMEWNLNIQHAISKDVSFSVGYNGSRGLHQPFRDEDSNWVLPTKTAQGYLWPSSGGVRVNPNAGTIRALWWNSRSSYHALQADLHSKIKTNLQLDGAFTWGKSLDNSSATIAGDQYNNSVPSLDWFDTSLSYGRSDFDQGKVLVINALYLIPDDPGKHGLFSIARNGWQIGGIYKQSSGTPFTPLIGGDPLGKGGSDPWDYPDRIASCDPINHNFKSTGLSYVNFACFPVPGGATPNPHLRGNASRNVITGPGLSNVDVSIFKNHAITKISDQFNVQIRAEAFNVLNHTNFAPPPVSNQQLYNAALAPLSTGGVLSSTSTTSRQLQFALKVIF